MTMSQGLTGKTVAITGASRGIGAAAARAFAEAGANVVLMARDREALTALAGEIGKAALAVPCDVTRYWEVEAALGAAADTFGGLDVLVSNAGVIDPISHIATADPEAWNQLIDINVKGVFHGARAALPLMLGRGGGTIINISSGAAVNALEGWSAYCTSKAAVKMFTACLHKELGGQGIRALGLSPGTVATDMQREITAAGVNPVSQLDWSDHIPPEWPAKALVWMCGEGADPWLGDDISLRDPDVRKAVGVGP
jgi:NAD(P)-dependent dehydrogenase (short-subunit alcohol dehydrogenase family)